MLVPVENPKILATRGYFSAAWDGAAPQREEEFQMGRFCAEKALQRLDPALPTRVSKNEDGSPRWPDGIVGSITHTQGFVSAAVARLQDYLGLGLDSGSLDCPTHAGRGAKHEA